jgi:hypothetical protein
MILKISNNNAVDFFKNGGSPLGHQFFFMIFYKAFDPLDQSNR